MNFFKNIYYNIVKYKFLVDLVVALIVVFYGQSFFQNINLLGQIISVLFIVSAINTINLIGGLDGLCAGLSSVYFATPSSTS